MHPESEKHRGHNGGRRSTAAALHAACLTYGFFYLDVGSLVEEGEMEVLAGLAKWVLCCYFCFLVLVLVNWVWVELVGFGLDLDFCYFETEIDGRMVDDDIESPVAVGVLVLLSCYLGLVMRLICMR